LEKREGFVRKNRAFSFFKFIKGGESARCCSTRGGRRIPSAPAKGGSEIDKRAYQGEKLTGVSKRSRVEMVCQPLRKLTPIFNLEGERKRIGLLVEREERRSPVLIRRTGRNKFDA